VNRRGRVVIGLIITPAIGFVVFRLALWGGLLAASLGFLATDHEVDEFPQVVLWIDLFSTLCAASVMFITIRWISNWGESITDSEPAEPEALDQSGQPQGREDSGQPQGREDSRE